MNANNPTSTLIPNELFPDTFSYLEFLRFPDRQRVISGVVSRALSHPACYRSQTAHLRSEVEHHARQAGMCDAADQLQALCTDLPQWHADAHGRPIYTEADVAQYVGATVDEVRTKIDQMQAAGELDGCIVRLNADDINPLH